MIQFLMSGLERCFLMMSDQARPQLFGESVTLNDEDNLTYWNLEAELKIVEGRKSLLARIFKLDSNEYSFEIKRVIAWSYYPIMLVSNWALEYFSDHDLDLLLRMFELDEVKVQALVHNKHLTSKDAMDILTDRFIFRSSHVKIFLFEALKDEIFDANFISGLLNEDRPLDLKIVADRIRKIKGLDESIPDEWIRKMFA